MVDGGPSAIIQVRGSHDVICCGHVTCNVSCDGHVTSNVSCDSHVTSNVSFDTHVTYNGCVMCHVIKDVVQPLVSSPDPTLFHV